MGVKRNDEADYTYVAEMARVMCHPRMLKALMAVGRSKRPINPLAIARENEWPVNDVAYHVRILAEMDAITSTNTELARGATKHMYAITSFGEEVLTWAGKWNAAVGSEHENAAPMPKRTDPKFARVTGKNLFVARKKSGLTQHELGKRAGLHRKTIRELEAGRQTMMTDTLFKLGGALGIEPNVLLDGLPPWNPSKHRFEFEDG